MVYLFRLALLLSPFNPSFAILLNTVYNYFFRDYKFFFDIISFAYIILLHLLLMSITNFHAILQVAIGMFDCIWFIFGFWFRFYYHILTDKRGRSLWEILSNPRHSISCSLHKKSGSRGHTRALRFFNANRVMLSYPQSQGAFAHIDEPSRPLVLSIVLSQLHDSRIFFDDPLRLSIPYEYFAKKQIEPPDGFLYDCIAFTTLCITFL